MHLNDGGGLAYEFLWGEAPPNEAELGVPQKHSAWGKRSSISDFQAKNAYNGIAKGGWM